MMAKDCCGDVYSTSSAVSPRFRKALWVALWLNLVMFVVEIGAGLKSDSVSLLADAIDFAGDAANYGLSLAVFSFGLLWRARGAWVKGISMGTYGIFILGKVAWNVFAGTTPEPITMGVIGMLALVTNGGVALMLYAYREGDANMRSVWLCSRNDAIGNIAVMFAALGVFGTGGAWPDLLVAALIGGLALWSSRAVIKQARGELATLARTAAA